MTLPHTIANLRLQASVCLIAAGHHEEATKDARQWIAMGYEPGHGDLRAALLCWRASIEEAARLNAEADRLEAEWTGRQRDAWARGCSVADLEAAMIAETRS